jgi:predicted Zn-dependent peptidase
MNKASAKSERTGGEISFTEYGLSNGLKVVLSEDSTIPSIAINLTYHTGSKDEDHDKRGYAHLFEHLMFEGSRNMAQGEYDRITVNAGCENNAYTTEDKTNYYLLVPSHQLELGLWLESDRMLGFAVTVDSLETQKEVVIEEKKQIFDNRPYGSVGLILPPKLYGNNGYSWDTIGDTGDIERAKLTDIKTFYEKYYVPNNAVLSIAGDIEIDRTIELIEKYFGSIPAGKTFERTTIDDKPLTKEVIENIYDDIQLPGIFLAYKVPKERSKEHYEFDILSDILSTGDSSRLYKELIYEKQLVSDIGCWVEGKEFAGVFYMYAILLPGVEVKEVQNEIDRIIAEVQNGGLTPRELEKVQNRIETRQTFRMQTNLTKADLLAHYKALYNDASMVNTNLSRFRAVTLEDIQRSASKYLVSQNRVILNYYPKDQKSNVTS